MSDGRRFRNVRERLDLQPEIPEFDVVIIDQLLRQPSGFCFVSAVEINAVLDVAIVPNDVSAIALHESPSRALASLKIYPVR